ncbi:ribbon-helix-helix protein, CopG family [Vibrio fluvialis]|nr:ribbon-helix-helix protein, CopG family [Vibrio fluvialis]
MKFDIEHLVENGIHDKNWVINYLSNKVGYKKNIRLENRRNILEINKIVNRNYNDDEIKLLCKKIRGAWSSKTHRENKKHQRPNQINISISDKSKKKLDRLTNNLETSQDDIIERAIAIIFDNLLPSRIINKSIPYVNRDIIQLLNNQIKEKDKIIKELKRFNGDG